ncbi:CLUMA_CG010081, isoform A [Clunio marinus]|uniref:CLUMA_CG010081, isoform A n=1 Tax=Clunio marinus TaxID=568069 RepID=A0A1J1IC09_9DIPT|nr:CLUMA_CG010081, isoform A [Clunio marinus]
MVIMLFAVGHFCGQIRWELKLHFESSSGEISLTPKQFSVRLPCQFTKKLLHSSFDDVGYECLFKTTFAVDKSLKFLIV